MSQPPDPMAEIRASFFVECEDLLDSAQDGLQIMADGDSGPDTLNSVFRAVHSIKGGAGAFGLDALVAFAHRFETVLDAVRSGTYTPDQDAITLFFRCADILSDLVGAARDGTNMTPDAVEETGQALESLVSAPEDDDFDASDFQPLGISLDFDDPEDNPTGTPIFHIRFKPEIQLYALGNEPLFLLRALGQIGDLDTTLDHTDVPFFEDLTDHSAHLQWHLTLRTETDRSEIDEVFEFVDDLCELEIVAPPPEAGAPLDLPDLSVFDAADDIGRGPVPDASASDVVEIPVTDSPGTAPQSGILHHTKPAPPTAATATQATVRVELERIDRLVNLVGELVINQAMLSQSVTAAGLTPNSPVVYGLEDLMQLTRDIQDSVMMIRAQPVKSLFQRMSRIVRETSANLGKSVRLKTHGETTEIDKTVIERLADPLTHMIRNAVDHGLETPQDRIAAGKPAEGLVTLSASHRSGRVVIEISDDGGGIDRARVLETALQRGLVAQDSQLTNGEIDNLLFAPGFSTVSEVTNVSGRGVGMDVVKSAIQSLGGRISISSSQGVGTAFSISLPLTLAVLDGMVVDVADETLVIPLNAIVETRTLASGDIRALGPQTNVVQIRDEFLPLLDLGTELGYRNPLKDYTGGIVLLIVHEDGSRAALVVDAIQDQRQVVIKGLQDSYGHVPGVAAATILGDGQIALILDPKDLTAHATGRTRPKSIPMKEVG